MFIANWKMNGSLPMIKDWLKVVGQEMESKTQSNCILCPPVCFLSIASELIQAHDLKVLLGAQDIDENGKTSLTGGISGSMLKELDTKYVIIGHSERRKKFDERDSLLLKKIESALENSLKVIFCVGETQSEKEKGLTKQTLDKQLEVIKDSDASNIMIAYEPVWAIGSGQSAKISYIREIHEHISNKMKLRHKEFLGVVYGGSVNSSTSKEIFSLDHVEGLLIGGASLEPKEFSTIALNSF